MIRALALLGFWKLRNSLKTILSDPRKLVPVLIMVFAIGAPLAFVGLLLGPLSPIHQSRSMHFTDAMRQARRFPTHQLFNPAALSNAVWITLIAFGVLVIAIVLSGGLLAFSMSDVDYVFPSPISRRVILGFKLPSITGRTAIAFVLPLSMFAFMFSTLSQINADSTFVGFPWWATPAAIFLSLGIYVNLALVVTLTVNKRKIVERLFGVFALIVALYVGLTGALQGASTLSTVLTTGWSRWVFLPSTLAAEVMTAPISQHSPHHQIALLLSGYVVTLIPMFAVNSNWYEQSIVITEKISAIREAVKGGASPFTASLNPKTLKSRIGSGQLYTVPAFGRGAWALVWAHVCAAGKKPWLICLGPIVAGVLFGIYGSAFKIHSFAPTTSVTTDKSGQMHFYSYSGFATINSMGVFTQLMFFMTAAMLFQSFSQLSCLAAIKRRELINPLPIPGYQAVAADLVVPFGVLIVLCVSATVTAAIAGKEAIWLFAFNMCLLLPLRIAARMVLQYLVLLGYPDATDPTNRLMAGIAYGVAAIPLLLVELLVAVPAIIFHSVWSAVLPLAILQIPFFIGLLMLTGKAREKAIATGEPVTLLGTLRNR